MTSHSHKNVIILPENEIAREFVLLHHPRKKEVGHLDLIFWAHLRISNSNIEEMAHYFKPKNSK